MDKLWCVESSLHKPFNKNKLAFGDCNLTVLKFYFKVGLALKRERSFLCVGWEVHQTCNYLFCLWSVCCSHSDAGQEEFNQGRQGAGALCKAESTQRLLFATVGAPLQGYPCCSGVHFDIALCWPERLRSWKGYWRHGGAACMCCSRIGAFSGSSWLRPLSDVNDSSIYPWKKPQDEISLLKWETNLVVWSLCLPETPSESPGKLLSSSVKRG